MQRTQRTILLIALAALLPILPASAARVRIKVATLAPDGSTWMKNFRAMSKEVKSKTNGEVYFKVYPGGVQGDEMDVLRKIRTGQLHGGGFTGLGMGKICPDTLVVAVPMLVSTYDEVDLIKEKLGGYFEKGIEKNGFVLLGWQEVGFVYLFSKRPITTMADLRRSKIWCWEGDPVAPDVFKTANINPVFLAMHDVLPALQTGMIDTVYNSPLGAVVLQWYTKTRYMTDTPLTYAFSGLVITKKIFRKIPRRYQPIVMEICRRHLRQQIVETRASNKEAVAALKKRGIQIVTLTPEAVRELRTVFMESGEVLAGKAFSKHILERTKQLLAEYRAAKGKGQ